jgi:uncharacterized protein (DUF2384 family)
MSQQIYQPPTRQQLLDDIRNIFREPREWLDSRNELLGGRKPADVIDSGDEGRDQVRDLLEAIKLGIPT